MPVWMFADIEGMRLPDEFSLEWDSKAKKYLAMVSIKFSIRAAHFPSIDWDDEQEVGSLMPVTRADLRAAVEAASILNRRISSRLNWVLVGMAVLGAALFWRHW